MLENNKKKRILVMSTPIGSGHVVAAEALIKEFEKHDVIVKHISVFDFIPQFIAAVFLKLYLLSLKISPKIYAGLYKWGNKKEKSTVTRDYLNIYLAKKAKNIICSWQPDVLVATHATAAGIFAVLKKRELLNVPLNGVVTDYIMHNWWYYPEVDNYYTPDIELELQLQKNQKLYKWGIPLRTEFTAEKKQPKEFLREKWQIRANTPICLLLGGGEGLLPMLEIIKNLDTDNKMTFITVTGKNSNLYKQINSLHCANVYNYGFVENMAELIELSDVVISKAGGISSTEILSRKVAYIIYKPLPGQEKNNAQYLRENYGVLVAETKKQLQVQFVQALKLKTPYKKKLNLQSTAMICANILDECIEKNR